MDKMIRSTFGFLYGKNWMLAAILAIYCSAASSQTLRGTVTDAISGEPLIGATVKIIEMENKASVTDLDGKFLINVGKGGRYSVETSYIGYESNMQKEVQVVGVKEVVLDIALRENANELKEVIVKPRVNKMATVNPTALVGGVMLSMEEASRFAGGGNDPSDW